MLSSTLTGFPLTLSLLLSTLLIGNVHCDSTSNAFRIYNVDEFIAFSDKVNSKYRFKGTTVYLEGDIDFSSAASAMANKSSLFYPIGNVTETYFEGVFDGQGYAVSGLQLDHAGEYVGLFGYSRGCEVRNLVLDASSSVDAGLRASSYIGSIFGYCYGTYRDCALRSVVNMAPVTAVNSSGTSTWLGGLAGRFYTLSHFALLVKDSANYGAVTFGGEVQTLNIGGVIGHVSLHQATEDELSSVQNTLNYAAIAITGSFRTAYLGGVAGWASYNVFDNCFSGASYTAAAAAEGPSAGRLYAGSIVGFIFSSYTLVRHSYWDDAAGYANLFGKVTAGTATVTRTDVAAPSKDTAAALSAYNASWNNWLHNPDGKTVTVRLTDGRPLPLTAPLILLPGLAEGWRHFVGWFGDAQFTNEFVAQEVTADTTLYGLWDKYLVTLDPNGGAAAQQYAEVAYGVKYPAIPDPTRSKATFDGWNTAADGTGDRVSKSSVCTRSFDHTLYAQWIIKRFYVTFNMSAGQSVEREVICTDPIVYPAAPVLEGFRFVGWDQNITEMPEHNVTINAVWEKITEYVRVVMETGELSREDVGYYFVRYTDDVFAIEYFSYDSSSGMTTVILKFSTVKKAEEFMETIASETDVVESFNYVPAGSLSATLFPTFSAISLFMFFSLFSFLFHF